MQPPQNTPAPKEAADYGFIEHEEMDAPLFNDSFWKDVADTKREIKRLSKELQQKKRILAIYYEGIRQYFEDVDIKEHIE